MSWNYRILAHVHKSGDAFYIHEVYYAEDGTPNGYSTDPCPAHGVKKKEIKSDLKKMRAALKKPILYAGPKFPQEYESSRKASKQKGGVKSN